MDIIFDELIQLKMLQNEIHMKIREVKPPNPCVTFQPALIRGVCITHINTFEAKQQIYSKKSQ